MMYVLRWKEGEGDETNGVKDKNQLSTDTHQIEPAHIVNIFFHNLCTDD